MNIFDNYTARYERTREEEYSMQEYLDLCKRDRLVYASASERMLAAIGEPELVDTRHDSRLSRIFSNKVIKIYPAFREFYGMEEVIEQVVSYFRHAAQGLEERKQILYLLGPVGGGKSSIAERLKFLMEKIPFIASRVPPSMNRLWVCSTKMRTAFYWKKISVFRVVILKTYPAPGPSSACMNLMVTSTSSASCGVIPQS